MEFYDESGRAGRASNIPGVKPSGLKGGDPPVLNDEVSQRKHYSGGLHVPIVDVGSWPTQTNSVLNVQIGLYRGKCAQTV